MTEKPQKKTFNADGFFQHLLKKHEKKEEAEKKIEKKRVTVLKDAPSLFSLKKDSSPL